WRTVSGPSNHSGPPADFAVLQHPICALSSSMPARLSFCSRAARRGQAGPLAGAETDKADTPLPHAYARACTHVLLPTLATSGIPIPRIGAMGLSRAPTAPTPHPAP